jgi:outer membrane protein OmpA-like peptidoglycan-associated protein
MVAGACATPSPQSASSGNPNQQVRQLEAALAAAKSNQVHILAPGLYSKAQVEFMKAKQALDKGAKLSDIAGHVTEGSTTLEKAKEIAQVSRTILGQTNDARAKALKVDADKLGERYNQVEKQYMNLTKAIENDNLSYAQKNAAKVQAAFRDVEIMAIKNDALGRARNMMAAADRAKRQKAAPTAYKDAVQALKEADAFIEKNPYSPDIINQKVGHAEFMARRVMAVSKSSEKFKKMTPELSALYVESLLDSLGKDMNAGDLRDRDVVDQVNMLAGTYDALKRERQLTASQNQTYQARIAALEQQLSGVQGYSRKQEEAKKRLAAERDFNERFNQVQRYFNTNEAEVYKQGNQLVIRLRGIRFPIGKAVLSPENYTLLSKVQKAIQTFDQPNVTVEGHTDSTGSAQINMELSQRRAESVKTYLVANNTLPENRIRAAGYGPDRPLAPNTTPEGRAINRRIDVLIAPSQTP